MQRFLDISVSAFLLLASAALFSVTFSDAFDVPTFGGDVGPAFAPRGFLAVWFVLALVLLVQAIRSDNDGDEQRVNLTQLLSAAVILVATGFAMTRIGFVLSAVPGFFLFCFAFGYRNYVVLVIASLAAPLLIWALFTFGFELLLPKSPWFNRI